MDFFPELEIIEGEDIKEVMGSMNEVIIYKSLESNAGELVEDTILIVNNIVQVDIKWNIDMVKEGDILEWVTSIAYNDGINISISRGSIKGKGTRKKGSKGFAFDPYFIPDELIGLPNSHKEFLNKGCTLSMLSEKNEKHRFSARIKALQAFQASEFILVKEISKIKPWQGEYQNE